MPFVPVDWDPPELVSINLIDDANTDLIRMRSGTLSWDAAAAKTGRNPDDVMRERIERFAQFDAAGLVFDIDPRKVGRAGLTQGPAPGTELPDTTPHDGDANAGHGDEGEDQDQRGGRFKPVA